MKNKEIKEVNAKKKDFKQEILLLIRSNDSPKVLCDALNEYHANDLAAILPLISAKEREMLYRFLKIDLMAEMMGYADDADKYLEEMDLKTAAAVLEEMDQDEAVDLLKTSSSKNKKAWLELMTAESQKEILQLAAFSEDTIGSRMSTNYVTLRSDMTIKEAMRSLIAQAAENDNISVLYALGENGIYYGAIDLKDLIIARQNTQLDELVTTTYPYVYAGEQIEDCLERLKGYYEESIPVLSDDNHILGIITAQDVIKVVGDEMGEDYAKLGGLIAEEDLREPLQISVKKRLPWLIMLLFLGMVVSSVVSFFEGTVLSRLTVLICFQSLILDMAGNVGTQSLAVAIRVLIDSGVNKEQKLRMIFKEMGTGGFNGLILGVVSSVFIGIYIIFSKQMPVGYAFAISICAGIALFLSMVVSSLVGTIVPVFFKHVGVDPAVASGPLITTINDLVGVVSYYGLAWIFLIDILHLG